MLFAERTFPGKSYSGLAWQWANSIGITSGGMYGGFQVLLGNPLSGRDILAYVIEHSETKILFVATNIKN
ncbi:MAG: hypothetical protein Ct9H300mP28_23880 [Pseudomonadota bacterium]|nr:MAG: hypothetical protein Ct9H300mP28_23880 [Pseudomonadota bacterium]